MDPDVDDNPFADPSIRQATAQTFSNQQPLRDYSPFTNTTVAAKPTPPVQPHVAATQQVPSYSSSATPMTGGQQGAEKYGSNTTRIDLSQLERQQAELEQREKRLMERERELRNSQLGGVPREKNFPPLPNWFPLRPCFYQDISVEIPTEFQIWVRYLYYLWLFYSTTLALNFITALAYFVVDKEGAQTFGLSILYFVLFIPCSYICWFRPIYRAFRADRAMDFMLFFFMFFFQICISVFMILGVKNSGFCGLFVMAHLFANGGKSIIVGILALIVTLSFGLIALGDGLLLLKVHRLYRQSGATLEQAQREFQSAFVNNPTVRGAAREVATAGINDSIHGSGFRQ